MSSTTKGPTDYPEVLEVSNTLSAGTPVAYTAKFSTLDVSEFSFHLTWAETLATFGATVELQGSNVINADEVTDADWVPQISAHGWSGFPAEPLAGSGKDSRDVSVASMFFYRLKFTRTAGEGTVAAVINRKGLG